MLALRYLKPRCLGSLRWSSTFSHWRGPYDSKGRGIKKERIQQIKPQKLSLLDELFPEEATTNNRAHPNEKDDTIPRLTLPDVDEFFDELPDDRDDGALHPGEVTKTAAKGAFRQHQLAVLVLEIASKSLVESDFRRIAPKGKHISEWSGPGDILKVIPARDPATLQQLEVYFILFPNPAYARTYQNHVLHLQRVARTYTPTSVESPLPVHRGTLLQGENIRGLLQDYALCPPSQRLFLKILGLPYSAAMKTLLERRGYPQLVDGEDKSGRSVLFWVDGSLQLATQTVRNTISADGRTRGMAWNVSVEKVDTPQATMDQVEELEDTEDDGSAELRVDRRAPTRWILAFADEAEARRFIRAWHRTHISFPRGEGPRLVHTEFLW